MYYVTTPSVVLELLGTGLAAELRIRLKEDVIGIIYIFISRLRHSFFRIHSELPFELQTIELHHVC